jgi:cyclic pyranopterin phosphate synthase
MTRKIIPIFNHRSPEVISELPPVLQAPIGPVADKLGRALRDLRISVTDRCNFRCVYCMPKQVFGKDFSFMPHTDMLTHEEIARVARIFVGHGVEKIRLTGGEPLLRKNIERLIELLSAIKTPDGRDLDLTLTTNGSILARKAQSLRNAGLQRITVSLDSIDDRVFRFMNDVDFPVADVLSGIEAAHAAGFAPIKINVVVKKGINEHQILPIARHFRNTPIIPRFIEYMDVGSSNGWRMDEVVPSSEVVRMIDAEMPLEEIERNYVGETAARWRYKDGGGEIGVIASVTQAFCRDCNRARLSTDGKLYTCLFATGGHDLRSLIRRGNTDEEIANALAHMWRARDDRYSELRGAHAQDDRKVEMSYIGG